VSLVAGLVVYAVTILTGRQIERRLVLPSAPVP
jgi:hypothetical protein